MLDIDFLQQSKPLKRIITYEPRTSLFTQRIENKILALSKLKSLLPTQTTPENLLTELNTPSLFGEKILLINTQDLEPHPKLLSTLISTLVEKKSQTPCYLRISPHYQEALKDDPLYLQLTKLSTHITSSHPTKGSLKKLAEFFSIDLGYQIQPSNPDPFIKALEHLLSQDEAFQKPQAIELFSKQIDLIYCLCFKGNEFDQISFNHYFKKEQEQVGYFRLHEALVNLTLSKKESKDHAITRVVAEVDSLIHKEGLDQRQLISRVLYALRDLLLINSTLGTIPEDSPHMSRFKRQKLLPHSQLEPTLLIRLQSLILINEPKLRNSQALTLDLQSQVLERFFV